MRISRLVGTAAVLALGVSVGAIGIAVAAPGTPGKSKATLARPRVTPNVAPAPARPDNLFVPVTSCRVADSRTPGIQSSGTARTLQVTGTGNLTMQGGGAMGCGIPTAATAVTVSVTALNETVAGYVTLYATGSTRPSVGNQLSFSQGVQITNSATVQLSSAGQLNAFVGASTSGKANLIFDVTGYYEPQIEAYVTADGQILTGTSRVLSVTHTAAGTYSLVADADVYNCSVTATIGIGQVGIATGYGASGNTFLVYTFAPDPMTGAFTATNVEFNVTVSC